MLWLLRVSHARPVDVLFSYPGASDAAPESFPSCLHASLAASGVSVCGPDESQEVGSLWLLPDAAFWRPKICIPILLEDYTSSERCLRGLVQMMEGKRSGPQMVLPIFSRAEPSQVRYLTGSFEKARHSGMEEVQRALFEVSMLHGWKTTDGLEEELVKTVVQTVLRCLQPDLQKISRVTLFSVFLNFRGADTRHTMAYELYTQLVDAGVSVFKDDTDLPIGEEFGSQLVSAITRSTMYVTIISPNYGSSKWCLHELAKMMECKESMGNTILSFLSGRTSIELGRQAPNSLDALCTSEKGSHAIMEDQRVVAEVVRMAGYHHRGAGLNQHS